MKGRPTVQAPPQVIHTHYQNLPLSSQQRLKAISDARIDPMKITRGFLGGPIFGVVVGFGMALLTYLFTFEDATYRRFDTGDSTFVAVLAFLTGAFLIGCALTIRRRSSAAVKSFWYLHPAYLIDSDFGKITAYPLLHLDKVNLTHHLTNGVYQYTDVAMIFGNTRLNLNYYGKDASAEFARSMLAYSDTARRLLQQGALHTLPEVDLFPAEGSKAAPSGSKWYLEWLGGGVAAGVLGFVFLPALHNQIADDNVFDWPCGRETLPTELPVGKSSSPYDYSSPSYTFNRVFDGCKDYLQEFPDGSHVAEADDKMFAAASISVSKLEEYKKVLPNGRNVAKFDQAVAELYNKAAAKYEKTASKEVSPKAQDGIKAMVEVIGALRDTKSSKVYVRYTPKLDFNGEMGDPRHFTIKEVAKSYPEVALDPVEPSFTPELNDMREGMISETLTKTFGNIIPEEIMRFEKLPMDAPVPADATVIFDIKYVIFLAPVIFRDTADRSKGSYDIRFDWTFTILLPKKADHKPFTFMTSTMAPDNIQSASAYERTFYGVMASEVFRDFGEHMKLIFGFEGTINKTASDLPPMPGADELNQLLQDAKDASSTKKKKGK